MKKIDQEIIELYDEYTHAPLSRRDFLDRLTKLAGTGAAALAMLPFLQNNYAQAAMVSENDKDLETGIKKIPFKEGKTIDVYYAVPKNGLSFPSIAVIHENRGLNPHIKDVVRKFAKEGFFAFAPDALSFEGGTPADEDKARSMIKALDNVDVMNLYRASIYKISKDPLSNGKTAAVGFCWGGGWANRLAVHCMKLSCSVAYYGKQLNIKESAKVRVPLLLHYAGLDERINAGINDFITNLSENQKDFTMHFYSSVNHAFNNDTNAARYNKQAAQLSWKRTIDFLNENLK